MASSDGCAPSHCGYGDDGDLASDYCRPSVMASVAFVAVAAAAAAALHDGEHADDDGADRTGTAANRRLAGRCYHPARPSFDDDGGDGDDPAEDGCHC